jgi:hypothetical protein
LHPDGNCPGIQPFTVDPPSELRAIYILPLQTTDFCDAHRGKSRHQGDFSFRMVRHLEEALELIEREHTGCFANHAG